MKMSPDMEMEMIKIFKSRLGFWGQFKDAIRKMLGRPRISIREEDGIHKAWIEDARKMRTVGELTRFIRHLTDDYAHDYGTIVHAISAAAIGAAHVVERSPYGGITGFQAGCVTWDLVTGWNPEYRDKPMAIMDFENMLYPQCEERFRSISQETWNWLQAEAKKRIKKRKKGSVHPKVLVHWKRIAMGRPPFGYWVRRK